MINNKIFYILHQKDFPKILISMVSQGFLSASHFLIAILMAKYAAKSAYGIYVIYFSIIYTIRAFHGAIILSPFQVLVNHKSEEDQAKYIGSLFTANFIINFPLVVVMLLAGSVYIEFNNFSRVYIAELFVLSIIIIIFVYKEFIRTLHFAAMRANKIFAMDFLNSITVIAAILLLAYYGMVTELSALIVLGLGYLVAYAVGRWNAPNYSVQPKKNIIDSLKENWNFGKWVTLGVTCAMLQDRGYIYITSILLNLDNLADISASRLFLMPIGLLNMSSAKIVIAKGAILFAQGRNIEFKKFTFSFISMLLIIWATYFLVVLFGSDMIVKFLGEKYAGINNLIFLWGIFFSINIVRFQLQTALIVYKKFKLLSLYDIWGAITVISSCIVLLYFVGSPGAIIAIIMGETLTMILYLRLYLITTRK